MTFLASVIGSIMCIPYIVLFFVVWIISSIWRPFMVLSWIAFLSQPAAALRKTQLLWTTIMFLVFNKDKKWKKTADPSPFFAVAAAAAAAAALPNETNKVSGSRIESKTIIFVRHGESNWNETFNKGSDRSKLQFILGFIPGLIKALFYEWYYAVSGYASSSWFYDSPLSEKGYRQALSVQTFLQSPVEYMTPKEAQIIKILLGQVAANQEEQDKNTTTPITTTTTTDDSSPDNGKKKKPRRSSVLVSSNLRRAIATMAVGFQDRLLNAENSADNDEQDDNDKIIILQSLQEISFNPDALSITPPCTKVAVDDNIPRLLAVESIGSSGSSPTSAPDTLLLHPGRLKRIYQDKIDVHLSHGNKSLQSNGIQRLQAFCYEIFNEPDLKDYSAIIVGGHSLWFKSFFQTYLPHATDHIAKRKKLINGAIVAFTLQRIKIVEHMPSSSSSTSSLPQQENEKATPTATQDEYQYMIDPSSIVVVHGGF